MKSVRYNAVVPDLEKARFKARKFMNKYNNHFPDDATPASLTADREAMLQQTFGHVGKDVFIEPPISVDYGCNISIGDNFYSNFRQGYHYMLNLRALSNGCISYSLVILDCSIIRIGNRVAFGPFVSIFAATHETDVLSRRQGVEYAKPVTIGDDCWIGGNVIIMPGVTIGKGCTIGAGSVVTKDIPDFSVAVGSPAKVVKKVDPVPDL